MEVNRRHWDEVAERHPATPFYSNAASRLRAGDAWLRQIETRELGDVRGKRMLHLQCHLGQESAAWAQLGAEVTAVDFSANALQGARALAADAQVDIRFIEANVLQLDALLDDRFDIVYTSWGVLGWLPDIARWAQVVQHFLHPGGVLYLAEFHPVGWMLDDESQEVRLKYSYFSDLPLVEESDGSYADRAMHVENRRTYNYYYTIGGVITALANAGMVVEYLHELPVTPEPSLPVYVPDETIFPGERWHALPAEAPTLPLAFTLRAHRPDA